MTRSDVSGAILTFALGVGVGAVAALLLAPKAGEELREDIAETVREGVNQARNLGKDLKRRTHKLVHEAADHARDAIDASEKAIT